MAYLRRLLPVGALLVVAGFTPAAFAFLVPGGGNATNDCLVELDLTGVEASQITNGKKVLCMDGDPCDTDGACDNQCTFEAAICILQADPALTSCTPPSALTSLKVKAKGLAVPVISGASCGTPTDVVLALKGKKFKDGKLTVNATAKQTANPKKDTDKFQLVCTKRVGACPTTTTTTSSTTSTTFPPACCGLPGANDTAASFLSFSTAAGTGTCGSYVSTNLNNPIACGGLYFGGGGNSVPLPGALPDLGNAISKITACTGQTATMGAATQAETGSQRNCTESGCFFGAPLAVPNPGSPPTSTCVLNQISAAVAGTVECSTGASQLTAPLSSIIYLTGDNSTDPAGTITGIQPCPLCSSGSCIGGPNNGMACTAGTTALNDAYPTSHDCPPDPMADIGTLPIGFSLTTGTVVWNATTATNDDEVSAPNQPRVFSGFCRDADDTGAFATPAQQCWENGMAVGTACTGTFETCEQRSQGAFGPGGGGFLTITVNGAAGGSLLDGPQLGAIAGIFSIPPTFNATVDAAGDLPGPGAVAIPGTAVLCADAMDCPAAP